MLSISTSQQYPYEWESHRVWVGTNHRKLHLQAPWKKVQNTLDPRDFPRQIIQEFAIFLALPFTNITNCAIKSGVFPDAYEIS